MANGRLHQGILDSRPSEGDDRPQLLEAVLDVVRAANQAQQTDELRARFSPPFFAEDRRSPRLGPVLVLDDGRLVVAAGDTWSLRRVWVATLRSVEPLVGVFGVGRSPDRRVYALGRVDGVHLTSEWGGRVQAVLPWPESYAPVRPDLTVPWRNGQPPVVDLIPFNDAKRVLMVSPAGAFVMSASGSLLIHPAGPDFERRIAEDGDEAFPLDLAAVHASLGPDQERIAVADQSSLHRVVSADGETKASFEPAAGHPHGAWFTPRGDRLLLAARDEARGQVVSVPVSSIDSDFHWSERAFEVVDDAAVVCAAATTDDSVILGGADGLVRNRGWSGQDQGITVLGDSITAVDLSKDGRWLAVCTASGALHCVDRAPESLDPYAIGTVPHCETRRWLFWPTEPSPLIW